MPTGYEVQQYKDVDTIARMLEDIASSLRLLVSAASTLVAVVEAWEQLREDRK